MYCAATPTLRLLYPFFPPSGQGMTSKARPGERREEGWEKDVADLSALP